MFFFDEQQILGRNIAKVAADAAFHAPLAAVEDLKDIPGGAVFFHEGACVCVRGIIDNGNAGEDRVFGGDVSPIAEALGGDCISFCAFGFCVHADLPFLLFLLRFYSSRVLTPNVKYTMWNTHTQARMIHGTYTALSIITVNPTAISTVTVAIMRNLVGRVMPLPCT